MWSISERGAYCVSTAMSLSPEFTALLSAKSMMRYLPPNGTPGLARTWDRIDSRSPSPPARMSVRTDGTRRFYGPASRTQCRAPQRRRMRDRYRRRYGTDPATAGIAKSATGMPPPVPEGREAVAPGWGGQVTFFVGMQKPKEPDGLGVRDPFGFGVADGDGVAFLVPHSAGKPRSPGIGAIGYLSLAGSAFGSLMFPDEPHWPFTTRSSNVLAAAAHVLGRPCSLTNLTRSRQPFTHESSGCGAVPSRKGTVI